MRRIYLLYLFFLVATLPLLAQQHKIGKQTITKPAAFKLSLTDYTDKIHAIWARQIICAQIDLKFENNEKAVKWVDSLPPDMHFAPLYYYYYEMITLKAFEKFGVKMSIEKLGEQWLKDSCRVLGSSKLAKRAMLRGIRPPASGDLFNNRLYNTIGPQFTSDIYGALAPGMTNVAGKLARYYGHINGFAEGTDGAVFVAGLISNAFNETDTKKIVQKAASLLSKKSLYRQYVDMVISTAKKGLSAPEIFDLIENRWRVLYTDSNNAMANGGMVAKCEWFGGGDFLKTLNLACNAADYWDADCNATNSASVVGAMHGLKAIPLYLLNALGDRIKGDRIGSINIIPATDEKISTLAIRTAKIGNAILRDNGVKLVGNILYIPQRPINTQIAELFNLNEIVKHWDAEWQIANVSHSIYLDQDALVNSPEIASIGTYLYRSFELADQGSLKLTVAAENNKCWKLKLLVDNDKIYS